MKAKKGRKFEMSSEIGRQDISLNLSLAQVHLQRGEL
jgi:hypothetical protein